MQVAKRCMVALALVAMYTLALASAEQIDIQLHIPVDDTGVDISHPLRMSSRQEDPLEYELADRANLMFRALDADKDRFISEQDVHASADQMAVHMPGVSAEEFMSFMQTADQNGDGKLNREELLHGIANGLDAHEQLQEAEAEPTLMETDASTTIRRRGIFKKIGGAIKKGVKFVGKVLFGKKKKRRGGQQKQGQQQKQGGPRGPGAVDVSQDGCVMCQYIVERCESNVKQSGVIPSMSQATAFDSYLEVASTAESNPASTTMQPGNEHFTPFTGSPVLETAMASDDAADAAEDEMAASELSEDDAMSLIELENGVASGQFYFDQTAAGIIGSTRQATRVQRQLERQKYNEIYRVVDITLDDVCEQGMPNSFYGFCKQVYKVQSDVVDGLRYQYRPADICFRVGMCGKGSYITKGVHSRYK